MKKEKKKNGIGKWIVTSGVSLVLVIAMIVAFVLTTAYEGVINLALRTETSRVETDPNDKTDTEYFKSAYKDENGNGTNSDEVKAAGMEIAEQLTEEGAVLLKNADAVLPIASNAKIIQIDIDPAEIDKNIRTHASIHGDVDDVLKLINERLEQQDHAEWKEEIAEYKAKFPLTYHPDVLTGPFIIEEVYKQTNGEAVIVTEVGQHQMWAAQFYKYSKPRTLLTSGGLGTMGYGLGASLGAKMGVPEKTVVNIAGDGCFRMNMNEIATAARYNIPIIQVVINNHVLGMVRQWQNLFYGQRYSATVLNDSVDFAKLAEAMGAVGMTVTTKEEFTEAFAKALTMGRPVVIDCQIDKDEKVWPMVAPGAAISEAFSEEDL